MVISFSVEGEPAPKGSMKAFVRGNRAIMTNDNKRTKPWQKMVEDAAQQAMYARGLVEPIDKPVSIDCTFWLSKPKTVKREYPHTKPDLDKLMRSVGDALEGVVVTNDSRIIEWNVSKLYCKEIPGIEMKVTVIE